MSSNDNTKAISTDDRLKQAYEILSQRN
ncbi:unnamed protein product, partial [Rotaria magnacalcarata]